jgi:hypothetical protein
VYGSLLFVIKMVTPDSNNDRSSEEVAVLVEIGAESVG